MRQGFLPSVVALALLAGCTVGPDYTGPASASSAGRTGRFVRIGDTPVASAPPVARWWQALNDPLLDTLEVRALAGSPTIAMAEARLRQASASLRLDKANRLPTVSASALYAHAHIPGLDLGDDDGTSGGDGGGGSTDLNIYNLGFNASWEADLFGGQRRAIEGARATAQASEADLADAQVSLTANVAQAYVNVRDRQQRRALSARSIAMLEQILDLARQRYARGTASKLDAERLSQQLDNARADAITLDAELEAYLNALATLLGEEPGAVDAMLVRVTPVPLPPAQIAIGDPAALLQRRPDIRAAERRLAADTARIGQAEAARFPRVSFMGIFGIGGSRPSDLTNLDDFVALLAPQISWSFLDFGRNAARVRQAEAVRDEAEARYRSSVLEALRDAEDSLTRFRYGRMNVATLARARASARTAAALSRERFAAGTTTLVDVLDAERQEIAAEQRLSTATAGLTGDFVGIQKALGLGWKAIDTQPSSR